MPRELGYLSLAQTWCEVEFPLAGQASPMYIGHARLLPGYHLRSEPNNRHYPVWWAIYLQRAPGELTVAGRRTPTSANAALLIDGRDQAQDWHYDGDGRGHPEVTVVFVSGTWFDHAAADVVRKHGALYDPAESAGLLRRLHLLASPSPKLPLSFTGAEAMAFSAELLWALVSSRNRDGSRLVASAKAWLDRNLDSDASVASLARALAVSREHLSRAFRSAYGLAPGEYHRRQRLRHASVLLATTSLPLKAIARECGFASDAAFVRSFHRVVGHTPDSYRDHPRPW